MFQLGLFEEPYTEPEKAQEIANSPASAARADEAHRKSIVLLRNDKNLLPIKGARKIYVETFAEPSKGRGAFDPERAAARAAMGDAPAGGPGAGPQPEGERGRGQGRRGGESNSVTQTNALKALLAKDSSVQVVDSLEQADVALVWLRPSVNQRPENDYADIALSKLTGIDVEKVKQIEAAKPTVLIINMINPWVINDVEPGAAAVLATFDIKAEALLDVVRGRFNPTGKLPITVPANQAAVDRNAPDVPGYAEAFDYAYRNTAKDKYIFGFGLSYGK